MNFKDQHPSLTVGFRKFQGLKPFYVRKLNERNTCCCVYHVKMDMLRLAVNAMRTDSKGIHGELCVCTCEVCRPNGEDNRCNARNMTYASVSELWRSCVCEKEPSCEWHRRTCLLRTCKVCPLPLFCRQELDLGNSHIVKWKYLEYVTENIGKGVVTKRIKEVYKETCAATLVSEFKKQLGEFIPHNFRSYWQNSQFKECINNLPTGVIVSVIDFAENYTFKVQNEVQSMHWYNDQCTILVHICYWRQDGELHKKSIFYISDDKKHDTLFVQHCFKLHHADLFSLGLTFNRHWVWSDGAASQFKAARSFYFIAR